MGVCVYMYLFDVYLHTHPFQIFQCQWRKIIQPVLSVRKLHDLLVLQAQRLHDVPLELGGAGFSSCFALMKK